MEIDQESDKKVNKVDGEQGELQILKFDPENDSNMQLERSDRADSFMQAFDQHAGTESMNQFNLPPELLN